MTYEERQEMIRSMTPEQREAVIRIVESESPATIAVARPVMELIRTAIPDYDIKKSDLGALPIFTTHNRLICRGGRKLCKG